MVDDLDEFLSRIDEISIDSFCSGSSYSAEYQKLQGENKKLKLLLITKRNENNEIVELYRQKAQSASNLQTLLDQAIQDCRKLSNQLDQANKENLNKNFTLTQHVNELKENQSQQSKDHTDLSREFLEVLSEVTCFYNYEIKKVETKRMITKTEMFLRKTLGNAFEKPKILQTKRGCDTDSDTPKTSTELGKKRSTKTRGSPSKRRKTNIWDMKSISQVSSPAASVDYIDEGTSDLSSGVFSIGNETSYSLLQNCSKVSEKLCNCDMADNNVTLVSIGTNTDYENPVVPPSVPSLLADDLIEVALNTSNEDHNHSSEETSEPVEENKESSVTGKELSEIFSSKSDQAFTSAEPSATLVPTFVSSSTSTEPEFFQSLKKLVNQGSSTDNCGPAVDKGTSTVHSLTTRGNQTVGVRQSDKGIQMPEVSFEAIWAETLFELPEILLPLNDEVELTRDASTITDLCNVTREIDLVRTPPLTDDVQEPLSKNTMEDETIFSLLGQTLFRLFLKRMQKSSKVVSNEDYARKQIWRLLRRELNDRYSELTFDDLLNSMYVEPEKYCAFPADDDMYDEFAMESKYTRKLVSPIKDIQYTLEKEDYEEGLPVQIEIPEPMVCSEKTNEISTEESVVVADLPSLAEEACSEMQMLVECPEPSQSISDNQAKQSEMAAPQIQPDVPAVAVVDTPVVTSIEESIETSDSTSKTEETINETLFEEPRVSVEHVELQETLSENDVPDLEFNIEFEEAMKELQSILPYPSSFLEPIEVLPDVIWNSLFPQKEVVDSDDSPADDQALDGFDIDFEPIDIPLDAEVEQILEQPTHEFTEFETPKSPPPFTESCSILEATIIPTVSRKTSKPSVHALFSFDPEVRKSVLHWQEKHKVSSKASEKLLCQARQAITTYLQSREWSQESLDKCVKAIGSINEPVMLQAIFETLEDNKMQDEISYEFTPPAPPLPCYQQKLIVLVQNLSQLKPNLPHKLFEDLECKIFNLESFATKSFEELRNLSYWATALIDLFLEGDPTIALHFIVKCIYFFGYKSIPMSFAIIKAFPSTIPKKSQLMKRYCKDIDWENMTGLQLSKVQMNVEWIESLELTVMFLLTSSHQIKTKRNETCPIKDHELFSFLPKFYGFQLSFITAPKLLDVLVQRLEAGRLENLSLSFILLAKRTNAEFTLQTMLKGKLVPLLRSSTGSDEMSPEMASRVCLLIEIISSILKGFSDEKEKSFGEIFALIVSILARSKDAKVKDHCLMAILRLQRFIDSQHEIFKIVKDNYQVANTNMNDTLSHSIRTFVHRKNAIFFKEAL